VGDFTGTRFEYAGVESSFNKKDEGFIVSTDNADGELTNFAVRYTFGLETLQQYLLEGPGGRLQALGVSWDSRPVEQGGARWFHLHPDEKVDHNDVLHWTRPSANWNYMCADCHSTALQKNYDPISRSYDTKFAEVSVGCEACHGQGARHAAWARGEIDGPSIVPLTTQAEQLNNCAPCHSRRSQLAERLVPGVNLFDYYLPALLDEGLYHPDGQILDEVYVYGSFAQSKMHERGVMCTNCHEPHSARLKIAGNGTCTQCHNAAGRPDFPTLPKADFDNPAHHFHEADTAGAQCVACHMADKTYMVVDARRDHSFRVPRPDLSVSLGVPNACNDCHQDKSPQWADEAITGWYGERRAAHFGPVLADARRGEPSAETALVAISQDAQQPAIVRATALSQMAGYGLHVSSAALEQGLRDEHPLVRIGALRGAQRWPPERRWRATRRLLDDERLAVRVEAVRGLISAVSALPQDAQQSLRPYLQKYLLTLAYNADVAEGQSNIASVHLALGDVPAAEAALQASLELNPQWVPAMVNLADVYRATGRDARGGELLDTALQLMPDAPDVLLAKALWLVRQGQTQSGLPLLEQAWRTVPENPRYAYVYVVALHSVGRSAEALQVADQTLARRRSEELLQAAFSIARDANLPDKMRAYEETLRQR
jgi:tetratricopeptide (TPR) repeat protein